MAESRGTLPVGVDRLRERIERWRQQRLKHGPMPTELWKSEVEMARAHGIYPVARALSIDYGSLKKRLDAAGDVARRVLQEMGPKASGPLWPWKQFPRKQWDAAIRALGWDQIEVARLRGWRFHDLRHHAASQMVMAGMSLYKVASVLGHNQPETTMRYAHLAPDSLAEDMERAFSPAVYGRKEKMAEVGIGRKPA